jgi:anti-sigma regulatory factor (Ser/Thr protein kinase)
MLHNGTGREPNRAYRDPVEVLRSTVGTPTDPLERRTPPAFEVVDPGDLHALRRDLGTALGPAQLPGTRRNDLVAAASEIVINALVHGRAPVGVRLWTTPGRALIAVRDAGDGFDDAFAGYLPPGTGHEGGMGLWLARQLCDHVDTVRQEGGFVVRLTSLA